MADLTLIITIVSAVLGAFLVGFANRFSASAPTRLAFTLICYGNVLYAAFLYTHARPLVVLFQASLFIYGPSVWWLVRSQISGIRTLFHWLHILPMVLVLLLALLPDRKLSLEIFLFGSFSQVIYAVVATRELVSNRHILANQNSVVWLGCFLFITFWEAGFGIFMYAASYLPQLQGWQNAVTLFEMTVAYALTIFFLWWALTKPEIYLGQKPAKQDLPPIITDFDRETFNKLKASFTQNKMFLHDKLNLNNVADKLAVTPRELSNAVNRCSRKSFRAYLREHRLEYAMAILADPERQSLSIFDVAMEAGFGTKSTFNDAFKAMTGLTPTEFRSGAR